MATIKEIAEVAGVSPTTVSLVLNNKTGISEETRVHVKRVLDSFSYVPTKKTRVFPVTSIVLIKYAEHGMIVEENQGFISSIIDQITRECRTNDIDVSLFSCDKNTINETFKNVANLDLNGIILIGTELSDAHSAVLDNIRIPLVVVDNAMAARNLNTVLMANPDIGFLATQYLIDCGHTHIGHLSSSISLQNFYWRHIGFQHALDINRLPDALTIQLTPTLQKAYEDMSRFLKNYKRDLPSAMFADNDTIAIGAMRALQEYGYIIPDDVSIIGVDNISFSSVSNPPLTTMSISRSEIGTQAVRLLQYKITHPETPPIRVQVNGELLIRGSVKMINS